VPVAVERRSGGEGVHGDRLALECPLDVLLPAATVRERGQKTCTPNCSAILAAILSMLPERAYSGVGESFCISVPVVNAGRYLPSG
jgi:hypothetical protein